MAIRQVKQIELMRLKVRLILNLLKMRRASNQIHNPLKMMITNNNQILNPLKMMMINRQIPNHLKTKVTTKTQMILQRSKKRPSAQNTCL